MSNESTTSRQSKQDDRQVILPRVDTSPAVRGKTVREWIGYLPAIIGLSAAGMAFMMGSVIIGVALLVISVTALSYLGVSIEAEMKESWYLTPRGFVEDHLSYRSLKRSLPWGIDAELRAKLHNVRHITADGSYHRHDGSRVALLRIEGLNMDRLPMQKTEARVRQLTNGIDEELGPVNPWWGFYATTRQATSDPHALEREERATDYHTDISGEHREVLSQTAEWLREKDTTIDANEWRYYAVVEVHPDDPEVELPSGSIAARARKHWNEFKETVSNKTGSHSDRDQNRTDHGEEQPPEKSDTADNPQDTDFTAEKEEESDDTVLIGEVLDRRVDLVTRAIERVEGVDVERADTVEHINVLRSYWQGRGAAIGTDSDGSPAHGGTDSLLQLAYQRGLDTDGVTPTERMLATGTFDVDGETVKLAGQYCRTFWIANWPVHPVAMFLDELFTFGGLDIDVRLHSKPLDQRAAADSVEEVGLDIGAETINRAKQSDFGALSVAGVDEVYENVYQQLERTNTDAWYLNGYVSVRAPTEEALEEACKSVTRRLEGNPAGCGPVAPATNQPAALTSCSPAGMDRYAREASGDREHIALSGAFGAMFPFGATDLSESEGIYWGRDTRTGKPVVVDPFDRGRAPHLFTIGMSRSGKSTFVRDRAGDWYLAGDDRTLIVTDMESGFGGLTRLCDGEHIVVDGNDPVNPWHIEPVSEERRRQTDDKLAPLAAQINFVTELTMNVIRAGLPTGSVSIDPDTYRIVRYAVGLTYDRAGITTDLDTHAEPSPTYDDFFDSLELIRNDPEEHTIRGTEGEREARRQQAEQLLERLIELTDRGQYSHLRGTGTTSLLDDDVSMAYLDMPQLQGSSDAAKSIGLQIALQQISQKIKRTPGKTIFAIDEAHVLYHSDEMVDWLAGAARRWARYDAAMWSISQSPEEFVKQQEDSSREAENKRQAIFEQASTMQSFYVGNADTDTLRQFGMATPQIQAVQNSLTPGKSADYSECIMNFDDQEGWIECKVETSPITKRIEERISGDSPTDSSASSVADDLDPLSDLDSTHRAQLRDAGIESPDDLLQVPPQKVAAICNASGERIDRWYDDALTKNGH